jgi:hypothetical protein
MTAASADDINDWVQAIATLHDTVATEPEDEAAAHEAAANLWSGFGYQDAPGDVLRMFSQAIEIGYLIALRDVRDGDFDDQITEWRPDLGS